MTESPPVRLGLLRLVDSAPVMLAKARGFFAQHGVDVTISIEPSWSNIADKLTYGLLDGAVMLPPPRAHSFTPPSVRPATSQRRNPK